MRIFLAAIVWLAVVAMPVSAQQLDSDQTGGTIAVTNTFQQVFPRNDVRRGCTVQNTGANKMYVFFGPIASATLANSFQLAAGQSLNCSLPNSAVIRSQTSITGTSADTFVASQQ